MRCLIRLLRMPRYASALFISAPLRMRDIEDVCLMFERRHARYTRHTLLRYALLTLIFIEARNGTQ